MLHKSTRGSVFNTPLLQIWSKPTAWYVGRAALRRNWLQCTTSGCYRVKTSLYISSRRIDTVYRITYYAVCVEQASISGYSAHRSSDRRQYGRYGSDWHCFCAFVIVILLLKTFGKHDTTYYLVNVEYDYSSFYCV